MAISENQDHDITLALASAWTENYRTTHPNEPIAHSFGKIAIQDILSQEDCVGIRIYYALDDDGNKQLVICGVKANEDDLFSGRLAEKSFVCPPRCGIANPLNS